MFSVKWAPERAVQRGSEFPGLVVSPEWSPYVEGPDSGLACAIEMRTGPAPDAAAVVAIDRVMQI
jgi:hypothetical protein